MGESRVKALAQEIIALPEAEREQLAQEVLSLLLMTGTGLAAIDRALEALSTQELDGLVERARRRCQDLPEATIAAVIGEALREVRAQGRP